MIVYGIEILWNNINVQQCMKPMLENDKFISQYLKSHLNRLYAYVR